MLVGSEAPSTTAHRLVESITQVAKASRRPMLDVTRANLESKVGNVLKIIMNAQCELRQPTEARDMVVIFQETEFMLTTVDLAV